MDAPTIPVSADSSEGNFGDAIDIGVNVVHPVPVVVVAFPAVTIVTTLARMAEVENASLRGKIKTMEAIETVTRSQEKRAPIEMERQLALVQESQRQDRENFRKLQDKKEWIKPLRVRALVMTIGLDLPKQILNAHTEAQKPENLKHEDVGGMIRKDIPKEKLEIERCLRFRLGKEVEQGSQYISCIQLEEGYADKPLAVPLDGLHIDDKLHFFEEQVEGMDREVKRLKQSRIPSVKVRWNSRRGPEFTWECKDQFRKKYPHLFTETAPSSSAAS
ncbi:hypothetical protein Tco_0849870 [Tanacetum coccineum]